MGLEFNNNVPSQILWNNNDVNLVSCNEKLVWPVDFTFTSFLFRSNQTGRTGPHDVHHTPEYNSSENPWLLNIHYYNLATGIQTWTVPETGTYRITAQGASGGIHGGSYYPAFPGDGATASGEFQLTVGTLLNIVVGQKPSSLTNSYGNGSGGGGGSWVWIGPSMHGSVSLYADELLIVAGGGGGSGHGTSSYTGGNGKGGSATMNSNESYYGESFGINTRRGSGSAGNNGIGHGGHAGSTYSYGWGGGGAGWFSNGRDSSNVSGRGGTKFYGGSSEDGTHMYGGFGGGGGAGGNGNSGGGGGGYTGGGGGQGWNGVHFGGGGGGGSYVAPRATNVNLAEGASGINYADTHNGTVLIEKL